MSATKRRKLPLRIAALLGTGYVAGGLLLTPIAARAGCDNPAPDAGQTTTCDAAAPNPDSVPVVAAPGSNDVAVDVQTGAGIGVANAHAVTIRDASAVNNAGDIAVTAGAFDGVIATGAGNTVNNLRTPRFPGPPATVWRCRTAAP